MWLLDGESEWPGPGRDDVACMSPNSQAVVLFARFEIVGVTVGFRETRFEGFEEAVGIACWWEGWSGFAQGLRSRKESSRGPSVARALASCGGKVVLAVSGLI